MIDLRPQTAKLLLLAPQLLNLSFETRQLAFQILDVISHNGLANRE